MISHLRTIHIVSALIFSLLELEKSVFADLAEFIDFEESDGESSAAHTEITEFETENNLNDLLNFIETDSEQEEDKDDIMELVMPTASPAKGAKTVIKHSPSHTFTLFPPNPVIRDYSLWPPLPKYMSLKTRVGRTTSPSPPSSPSPKPKKSVSSFMKLPSVESATKSSKEQEKPKFKEPGLPGPSKLPKSQHSTAPNTKAITLIPAFGPPSPSGSKPAFNAKRIMSNFSSIEGVDIGSEDNIDKEKKKRTHINKEKSNSAVVKKNPSRSTRQSNRYPE